LRKIVHLDNELLFLARTRLDSEKFLPDCLNSSQMWLIPPVDDRQYVYWKKLKKIPCSLIAFPFVKPM
jgi:hypothetical protein